jgi:hypothetical protein
MKTKTLSIFALACAIIAGPLSLLFTPENPFAAEATLELVEQGTISLPEQATKTRFTRASRPLRRESSPLVATAEPAPRVRFTLAEEAAAVIPGIPNARFWTDSEQDFSSALPRDPGPWLILSSGGEDGAFGAGLLNGLTVAKKRFPFAVGALIAPFAFAGSRYDDALRKAYTEITAADVYQVGGTAACLAVPGGAFKLLLCHLKNSFLWLAV